MNKVSDNIVKVGGNIMMDNKNFLVNFSLGNFCNYSCSYCWPAVHAGTHPFRNFNFYSLFIDDLKDEIYKRHFNSLSILFTGGEPTAYKFLPKVIKNFCNDDRRIKNNLLLNTNLSPALSWWDKFLKISNKANARFIVASFHHEFADTDLFIKKAAYLKEKGVGVIIRKVVKPTEQDINYCIDLFHQFEKEGLYFEMKPYLHNAPQKKGSTTFVGKKIHEGFTDEMFSRLEETQKSSKYISDAELIKISLFDSDGTEKNIDSEMGLFYGNGLNFNGWNCSAGFNHLSISHDGNIQRCFDIKNKEAILGNIYEGTFKLHDTPTPCPVTSCSCITCLLTQKERINGE